jgi:hypothetical protein
MRLKTLAAAAAAALALSTQASAATFSFTGIVPDVVGGGFNANASTPTGSSGPIGSIIVGHTSSNFLYRSGLAFDISSLAGYTVTGATLTLDPANTLPNVSGDVGDLVALSLPAAFTGDLVAQFPTFGSIVGTFITDIIAPTGAASGLPINFNVTSAVAASVLAGRSYTGFGLVDNASANGTTNQYLGFNKSSDSTGKPTLTITAVPVPEPGTMALVASGLAVVGLRSRRRSG